MMSTNDRARILERTFNTTRIKWSVSTVLLLPYIPIGCFIATARFCLLINFLIAWNILRLLFDGNSLFMKSIMHLFMIILGIGVRLHGKRMPTQIIICNRRSAIDGFVMCFLLNVFAVDKWNLPNHTLPLLQLRSPEKKIAGKGPSLVLFPEMYATTGQYLTPFDSSYFLGVSSIQPAAITYWRPFPISLSTISGGAWSDIFWMFFNPVTIINIFLSPDCIHCRDDIIKESCCSESMHIIAKLLGKSIIDISPQELSQYVDSLTPMPDHKISQPMLIMVKKVEEVTPHVPRNVILADLQKTESVDVTLANIFEGVVDFIPIKSGQPQKTKSGKTSHQYLQLSPFEKRKAELMETARRRYKEKHGL